MQKSLLGHRVKSRSSRKTDRRRVTKEELAKRKLKNLTGSAVCMRCKKRKPKRQFYITFRKTLQRRTECNKCANKRVRKWKRTHKYALRLHNAKYHYGLTQSEYRELYKKHRFRCAICNKTAKENGKRMAIDHDHKTGKVRGLLCWHCNCGLGSFHDNQKWLRNAIQYLQGHR